MKGKKRTFASTSALLDSVHTLKTTFNPEAAAAKAALLVALSAREMTNPKQLAAYHDLLLFIRAYPDNRKLMEFTERELQRFADRIAAFKAAKRDASARKLLDSGIVDTITSHTFGYEIAQSLARRYPKLLEIDWENYDEESDPLLGVYPLITAWNESDSLDNDPDVTGRNWLGRTEPTSSVGALMQMFRSSGLPVSVQRYLYENLELYLSWTLENCKASRTLRRVPARESFFQAEPIKPRTTDLRGEFARPAVPLVQLPVSEGKKRVQDIQEVLAVRNRELFPLAGATEHEVYLVSPGRGLDIYIYGTQFDIRLPLESNFGAMLVRNGVPIGYGVAAVFLERVEIAINVFPAYRNGESSFAIEEYFRIFYHHFGSREFLVRSYQVGDDNDEALESGSFWFYYKLGFRPVDPKVRQLAEVENGKVKAKKGYRTPLKTLTRLAKSDMYLTAEAADMAKFRELSIVNLSYAVSQWMAEKGDHDRKAGTKKAVEAVQSALKLSSLAGWSADEKAALARLAPLVASLDGIAEWTAQEKELLAKAIRGKGSRMERDFVLACNSHKRLKEAFRKIAGKKTAD